MIILLIAAIGLGIRSFLRYKGNFPETDISRNEKMSERGIVCTRHTDMGCNPGFTGCSCNKQ